MSTWVGASPSPVETSALICTGTESTARTSHGPQSMTATLLNIPSPSGIIFSNSSAYLAGTLIAPSDKVVVTFRRTKRWCVGLPSQA